MRVGHHWSVIITAATTHPNLDPPLSGLARKSASDVKREGWRGVMKSVDADGTVLMTNHDRPEAVILSVQTYQRLSALADRAQEADQRRLDALRYAFDQDLAALQAADAGDRLRQAFASPLELNGKVIAGSSY